MEKYIMYLRKSRMDSDYDEISVEETLKRHKIKLTNEIVNKRKLYVEHILEEVVSGESLYQRPQMMKCLELINSGEYAGVICKDIDRLSRGNSMDSGYIMQVFKINKCRILTLDKTYDLNNDSDEQFTDIKFLFSRYEFKEINKRLIAGREASASEGKYLGSTPPYGYEVCKLVGVKGNTLKAVPEKAKVVQLIFDLYTEKGMGYSKICSELDRLGIKASYPLKEFNRHSIQRILKNPVYTGKIRYKFKPTQRIMVDGKIQKKRYRNHEGYELHEGLHEAIISEEQWEKAEKARSTNLPVTINHELCNPFSRIVKCGKCGRTIVRRTTTASPKKYRLSCPNRGCDNRSIFLAPFEDAVVAELTEWLKTYTIQVKGGVSEDSALPALLEETKRQLADTTLQQEKICEFLETGVYTIQMFTQRNSKLQAEIDALSKTIEALKAEIAVQKEKSQNNSEIIPRAQQLLGNYDSMTPREKNDLWKEVVDHIELTAEPKQKDFHIDIFPKI